jgi:hypothetical protein
VDRTTIQLSHIKRLETNLASKVDQVIGRFVRFDAQYTTVDSWLQDHQLPVDPKLTANRSSFNSLLRKAFSHERSAQAEPRTPGPKAKILPRLMARMIADLESGVLSEAELENMPDKEREFRYEAKRERCAVAVTRVLRARREKNNSNK